MLLLIQIIQVQTASITVPAGSQSASFTLTGIDDAHDEKLKLFPLLCIQTDEEGNSISNVELSSDVSLDVQISDDEAPVVSFTTSELKFLKMTEVLSLLQLFQMLN
jgi:hypothetical protein